MNKIVNLLLTPQLTKIINKHFKFIIELEAFMYLFPDSCIIYYTLFNSSFLYISNEIKVLKLFDYINNELDIRDNLPKDYL